MSTVSPFLLVPSMGLLCSLVIAVAPASADVAQQDGWTALGTGPTTDCPFGSCGVIDLAFASDGTLYAGLGNGLGRWDGAAWTHYDPQGVVKAIAVDGEGHVYLGGQFTPADPSGTYPVAVWDGAAWRYLGGGASGSQVETLAFGPDGALYAGGLLTEIGQFVGVGLARWDGDAWQPVTGAPAGIVLALAFDGGTLYAGGDFDALPGGETVNNVARWDGTAWSPLGGGLPVDLGNAGGVQDLAFGPDGTLYAAGSYQTTGPLFNGVARWDGTAWSALGEREANFIDGLQTSLAVDAEGRLYRGGAVGISDLETGTVVFHQVGVWDGTRWLPLDRSEFGGVLALVFDAGGDLYAGGPFLDIDGVRVNGVAKWEGTLPTAAGAAVEMPRRFHLGGAYPNPFAVRMQFTLALPTPQAVTVAVYDAAGRVVARLHEGPLGAGAHRLVWDAAGVPSGVYVIQVVGGGSSASLRVTLVR